MEIQDTKYVFSECAGVILLVSVYVLLFGKYRPVEIDDAWTASYVWALTHLHSSVDRVFGLPSNIQFFGHIHAYLAGAAADAFGWSKRIFHGFNTLCMAGAAGAWWVIARNLAPRRGLALLFVVLLFLLEPFIGAALKARSDALAFMFMSFGVCAALYRHFFMAALLACLGIEIHPIALVGASWVAVFALLHHREDPHRHRAVIRNIGWCLLGTAAGFCLYRHFHPEPFADIVRYLLHSNEGGARSFNALTAHYFTRAYFRFIPELIFLLAGAFLFFYKKKRLIDVSDPVCLLFWVTLALSLVLRRANFHYVIFFYPPLMLSALAGFEQTRWFRPAAALLLTYALALNGLLFWQNRNVDHDAFDRDLLFMAVPDDGTPVVGPVNAWFALRERLFYADFSAMRRDRGEFPEQVYYIRSIYSDVPPTCARTVQSIGRPFIFNGTEVDAQILNLGACIQK
jgi:hypothetical protein